MGRVDFHSGGFLKAVPISKNTCNELCLSALTLGSASEVIYLSFNAIAVLAQHPTDKPCLVVVVKAGGHAPEVYLAQPAEAILGESNLVTEGWDIFYF